MLFLLRWLPETDVLARPRGERKAAHMPFLLHKSLPALAEYYGDFFVSLNVSAR